MGIVITNNIVLIADSDPAAQQMTYAYAPRIGWRDVWREGTVTASSERTPARLATNGLTYDAWLANDGGEQWLAVSTGSGPLDYIGVAGHDLGGGSIRPQWFDGDDWHDLAPETVPATRGPLLWYFPRRMAAQYRLLIQGAILPPALGVVMGGLATVPDSGLPVGWEPPSLNQAIEGSNVISEGGQLLGRHIRRRGVRTDCSLQHISYPWSRTQWSEFLEHAYRRGFFLWWTFAGYSEVVYGGMTSHQGQFSEWDSVDLSFEMQGVATGSDGTVGVSDGTVGAALIDENGAFVLVDIG